MGKGSGKGDEPRRAVIATCLVAQAALFIGNLNTPLTTFRDHAKCLTTCCVVAGDLNTVAPIITTFFCLSYGMVCLCCFLVQISGTPNFRPRFKYFTWWTSLVGTTYTSILLRCFRFVCAALPPLVVVVVVYSAAMVF